MHQDQKRKINKMKINKMKYGRDTEWPDKLQPAVFAANTQFKRFTEYTPFRLMFGRECDPFGLLKLITGTPEETEIQEEESIDDGIQTDDIQSTQLVPSQLLDFTCTDGWIQQVEETELSTEPLLLRISEVSRKLRSNI